MTQEEKAKRYDEAIKLAKDSFSYPDYPGFIRADVVFPELKESEDERIRKEIIEMLRSWASAHYITKEKFSERMTWLEKQGKETSWKPSKEEMDVLYGLAYITNQYDEHKEGVITRLYQDLKREFFNDSSYENMFPTNTSTEDDVRRRSTIQILEYARSLDAYNQYGKADIDKNIAWLEKQDEHSIYNVPSREIILAIWDLGNEWKELTNGSISTEFGTQLDYIQKHWKESEYYLRENQDKQKPQGKSALEAIKEEKVDNQNCIKPIDKIEPKFKIEKDKWYVCIRDLYDNYAFCKGSKYYSTKDETLLPDNSNIPFEIKYCVDYFRPWSLQDAKDGDVLVDEDNNIGIFQKCEGKYWYSYIYLGCDGEIRGFSIGGCHRQTDTQPATKEQRDLLFTKMKEAGYEWDVDKKELRKEEIK